MDVNLAVIDDATRGPSIIDGATARVIRCRDPHRVLYAYETAIDTLIDRFTADPSSRSRMQLPLPNASAVHWPFPGKQLAHEHWKQRFRDRAACDLPTLHSVGPYNAAAFLLGAEHLVFDPKTETLRTSEGKPPQELDPTPVIRMAGPRFRYGLFKAQADAVELAVRELLPIFDFTVQIRPALQPPLATVPRYIVDIRFTHHDFVHGNRWGLVRCADPQGKPAHHRPRKS